MKKETNFLRGIAPFLGLSFILLLWLILSFFISPALLPSPYSVILVFINDAQLLGFHLLHTVMVAATGAVWGIILGMAFGLLLNLSPGFARTFTPFLTMTQTVPLVFLYPLLLLWLGFGPLPRILIVILGTFLPVTLGFYRGLRSAEPQLLEMFSAMKAPKGFIFRHIIFPGSLESLWAGINLAVLYIIPATVVSEWMGAREGLGVYMIRSYKGFRLDQVTAAIIIVSVLSFLLWKLTQHLEIKFVFWKKQEVI